MLFSRMESIRQYWTCIYLGPHPLPSQVLVIQSLVMSIDLHRNACFALSAVLHVNYVLCGSSVWRQMYPQDLGTN